MSEFPCLRDGLLKFCVFSVSILASTAGGDSLATKFTHRVGQVAEPQPADVRHSTEHFHFIRDVGLLLKVSRGVAFFAFEGSREGSESKTQLENKHLLETTDEL